MSPFEKKVKVLFMTQKEFRFVSLGCIQWEGRISPMVFPKKTRQQIATLCSFTFPHHETKFSSRLYAPRSSERHCQARSACQKRSRAHKRADAVNTRFWEKTGLVISNAVLFYCLIRSMSNLHMWFRTRQVCHPGWKMIFGGALTTYETKRLNVSLEIHFWIWGINSKHIYSEYIQLVYSSWKIVWSFQVWFLSEYSNMRLQVW